MVKCGSLWLYQDSIDCASKIRRAVSCLMFPFLYFQCFYSAGLYRLVRAFAKVRLVIA